MTPRQICLILLIISSIATATSAQSFYSRRIERTWMFSYGTGASTYHGDLNDLFYDRIGAALGANLGIGLRKKVGSQLSLRFDFNYYTIGGSDSASGFLRGKTPDKRKGERDGERDTRFIRNLSFSATNFEFSLLSTFTLIPEEKRFGKRPKINPYLFMGLGLSTNNPQGKHPTAGKVNLRKLNTEALPNGGYSGIILVLPVGVGIKFRANKYIDILVEGGRRFIFTDYLDDVSTVYPGSDELLAAPRAGSDELALIFFDRSVEGGYPARKPGKTRGNPDRKDAYYIFQVRLEMYLPHNFFKDLFNRRYYKPKFR